jgi:hypothetical protein
VDNLDLENLLEWKRLCAVDKCSTKTQLALGRHGKALFHKFAQSESGFAADVDLPDEPRAALKNDENQIQCNSWRLLEQHALTKGTQAGKRYNEPLG